MTSAHLYSSCPKEPSSICRNPQCSERVKVDREGRWFITMGHAGFNLPANNRNGYATQPQARAASIRLNPINLTGPDPLDRDVSTDDMRVPFSVDAYAAARHSAGLVWLG